ncbi:hypothetical protein FGO68_gene3668 [Halteria grandinella]|uniref:Uncharacterized protein n=1 Tax=Halteria grandinella TaxID=5974 RepID=A0A8J8T3F2_HALGN|nr:hypothetical protein FGO68_gene3668 [Halteria grandinella]
MQLPPFINQVPNECSDGKCIMLKLPISFCDKVGNELIKQNQQGVMRAAHCQFYRDLDRLSEVNIFMFTLNKLVNNWIRFKTLAEEARKCYLHKEICMIFTISRGAPFQSFEFNQSFCIALIVTSLIVSIIPRSLSLYKAEDITFLFCYHCKSL